MTVATAEPLAPRVPAATRVGQGTAVEQSRAVAEVEAAIVVAMRHPRNVSRAIADMRETCQRKELADRAFFRYRRGKDNITGPSVHLARELARVWGNVQYGLTELRRDDEYGQSEMLAYAWDVQTNTRCASVVINPHRGYTGGRELADLRDIYENNANVGARRVREAIFAVLPAWFVEEAKDLCAKTIADGGGVTLPTRIANAIEVFGNLGVTLAQLEEKIGRPQAKWTDHDVAQLRIIRQSLLRGETTRDDEFPQDRVTAADITGHAAGTAPAGGSSARPGKTMLALRNLTDSLELGPDEDVIAVYEWLGGAPWKATPDQVRKVLAALQAIVTEAGAELPGAREEVWKRYKVAQHPGPAS